MINLNIQQHLRNKYNPDGSPLRCHQLKMLDMLKYIDVFCRDNNISYWLSSGTCLGAVRHGGFIPWDDDVDIEMFRSDYLKFQKIFKETEQYILQTHKNDLFYFTTFSKVRDKNTQIYDSLYRYKGIFVDVFPLEYTNKTLSLIAEKIKQPFSWTLYNYIKFHKNSFFVKSFCIPLFVIAKYIYFTIPPIFRFISKFLPNNKLRHSYGTGWIENIRKVDDIIKPVRIPFEDVLLPVPRDYDSYLTHIYGPDYMSIPPTECIQPNHVQYFNK